MFVKHRQSEKLELIRRSENSIPSAQSSDDELLLFILLFSKSSYKVEFKVIREGGGGLHCVSTHLKFIQRQPEGVL